MEHGYLCEGKDWSRGSGSWLILLVYCIYL